MSVVHSGLHPRADSENECSYSTAYTKGCG